MYDVQGDLIRGGMYIRYELGKGVFSNRVEEYYGYVTRSFLSNDERINRSYCIVEGFFDNKSERKIFIKHKPAILRFSELPDSIKDIISDINVYYLSHIGCEKYPCYDKLEVF